MTVKVLVISDYREYISSRPEAELFLGLKKEGFDITVMTYPGTEYANKFREAGIKVIEFHPDKKFHRPSIKFIRNVLKEGGFHIMHLFNSRASSNGIIAARQFRVKVVLYRGFKGNIHWYDPTQYLKYFHPRVDKIVCLIPAIEKLVRKNSLFARNKTITISKGHHLDWYKDVQPVTSFKEFGIPDQAFLVICTANVRPMKGIPYLVQATHYLPKEEPIYFLFVGNGFDQPKIQKLIQESPFRNKIFCSGYVTDPLRLVAAAQLFVLPSIKGEGLNKSLIEAMALSVAPVITNIPGNSALVVHNQCGLLVPPKDPKALADAILRIYRDTEFRKKLAANARLQIQENFNIETTIQKTKALYLELASSLKE